MSDDDVQVSYSFTANIRLSKRTDDAIDIKQM